MDRMRLGHKPSYAPIGEEFEPCCTRTCYLCTTRTVFQVLIGLFIILLILITGMVAMYLLCEIFSPNGCNLFSNNTINPINATSLPS